MDSMIQRSHVPARRGNKAKLWDDEDLAALEKLLLEHPVLESPGTCSHSMARYRASLLRKELNDRGRLKVRQRVWPEDGQYRWAVYLEGS